MKHLLPSHWLRQAFGVLSVLFLFAPILRAQAFLNIIWSGPGQALPNQIAPGDTAMFQTDSLPLPTGQLQWLHNGAAIAGANSNTLTLSNLTTADTGNYQLVVTNSNPLVASNTLTLNVLPLPPDPIDTTFASQLTNTATVKYTPVAFASDGSMVLSGADYSTGSQTVVVRLHNDGSLDSSFNYPLSAGAVLAGFPNGSLIVANAPYRLNADGSANTLALPAGFDSTKPLTAAAIQTDGKILLAQGTLLARLNADGSLDATFVYSSRQNSSANGVTYTTPTDSLQVDSLGRIYVHGVTTETDYNRFSNVYDIAYRLLPTGADDTTFSLQYPLHPSGNVQLYLLNNGSVVERLNDYLEVFYLLLDNGTSTGASIGNTYPLGNFAIDPVHGLLFSGPGEIQRWTITSAGLVLDPTFYAGNGLWTGLQATPDGKLLVLLGKGSQWDGYASPGIVRLIDNTPGPTLPPTASIASNPYPAQIGQPLTLTASVQGTGPFTYQWLALDGQTLPGTTTSSTLTIPSYTSANAGRYQVQVTGPGGTVLSPVSQTLTTDSSAVYLSNLSGRAMSGTGEDTIIAGLTVNINSGTQGIATLLRGAGPSLEPLGVSDFLPNPLLTLYDVNGNVIGNNDNWGNDPALQNAFTLTGAFSFTANSNDSALLHTFAHGNYTLMLTNQGPGSGVGLVEVYRTDSNSAQSLTNLSLRANTGPGDATAIVGFVLVDPQNQGRSRQVLLRAVGPTLAQYGIVHPLADPILTLYDSKGNVIASNDNWGDTNAAALVAAIGQVGAFALPTGSKDSALLVDLPAGVYTMHATSAANSSGVVLLEIYLMP